MQEVGNCDAFQYIQSFEITPDGLMWLPDVGRVTDDQAGAQHPVGSNSVRWS